MHIKRGIKFNLHKRKAGDTKNLAVRMRVTLRGEQPIDFPTGHNIDLEYWDSDNGRATGKTADEINRTIDEYRAVMNEIFARYELIEKRIPTPGEVKDLFNDMIGQKTALTDGLPGDDADFFKIFDLFVSSESERNQWTTGTMQKFHALRNHLTGFDPRLSFYSITESKLQEYAKYLTQNGLRNTTLAKNLALLRWFLRWAAKKGYYSGNAHATFRPKIKGVDGNSKEIIYLTEDEIKKLQSYEFTSGQHYLERVRDVFLFCCFTGLRYSDAAKLTREDVKEDHIEIVTQKTSDGLRIELNKHSRAILEKYAGEKFSRNLALPVISNQKMNDYLKELGQLCEINEPQKVVYYRGSKRCESVFPKWQLLTTHCGRRTFVVNALRLGIPSEVIIRWTGHSDFKAMKPYVKIVDDLKKQSMAKFDSL